MSESKEGSKIFDGIYLIDKPAGPTSHDIVNLIRVILRRALQCPTSNPLLPNPLLPKVGHAGTLDPFASGLLIIGVGTATKTLANYVKLDKEYEAVICLGARSSTHDPEGELCPTPDLENRVLKREELLSAVQTLKEEITQIPPMHSAIKMAGKKLYELARAGKEIERRPRPIIIHSFELLTDNSDDFNRLPICLPFLIRCSSGTYIRALARDLGETLCLGAYVKELRRTAIGQFRVENAKKIEELQTDPLLFKINGAKVTPSLN